MSASTTVESIRAARAREPRLALGLGDHHPRDLLHHLGPEPPGELADRRLVRHPLIDRDQTEPPQMQRVRHLAHQRLVAPAGALLDHHQPHERCHRDRRPPPLARRRAPTPARSAPTAPDRPAPRSSRARSSGSSRTSTGSTSSHNDSTCPPTSVSITPPPSQKTIHEQANSLKPSRTEPARSDRPSCDPHRQPNRGGARCPDPDATSPAPAAQAAKSNAAAESNAAPPRTSSPALTSRCSRAQAIHDLAGLSETARSTTSGKDSWTSRPSTSRCSSHSPS